MRFQEGYGEVQLCRGVGDVQRRARGPEFTAAIVRPGGRTKARGGLARTRRIYDVHCDAGAGIGGKADKICCVHVLKAGLIDKSETDAIAEREVSRL